MSSSIKRQQNGYPDDDASLLRVINTPARSLSGATVESALEWSVRRRSSLWRALRSADFLVTLSGRTSASVQGYAELIDGYETKLNEPLVDESAVIGKLMTEIGYAADLRRSCKTEAEADGLSRTCSTCCAISRNSPGVWRKVCAVSSMRSCSIRSRKGKTRGH